MGHQHRGNYSAKHISGALVAKPILNAVRSRSEKGKIRCEDAHRIARDLGISAQQVGVAIDLSETRIICCQLGLFNKDHDPEADQLPTQMPPDLQQLVKAASKAGKIACIRAWQIADTHDLSRAIVGEACEQEGIKICKCQLGAF